LFRTNTKNDRVEKYTDQGWVPAAAAEVSGLVRPGTPPRQEKLSEVEKMEYRKMFRDVLEKFKEANKGRNISEVDMNNAVRARVDKLWESKYGKNNTDAIIDPYESQTSDTIIDPYEQGAVVASEEKKKNFLTKLAEGVKQVDWGLLSQSPRAALELAAMQASGVGGAVGGAATGLATHGIVSAGKALGGFKDIPSAADAAKAVSQGVANVLTYDPRKSATSTELGRRAADIMTGEAEESSMPITNFLATLPFKSAEAISGIGKDVVKTAGEMYRQTPLGKVTPEGVYEFAEYPAEVVGEFAPWVLAERGVRREVRELRMSCEKQLLRGR